MSDWPEFKFTIKKINDSCLKIDYLTLRTPVVNDNPHYMTDDPVYIDPHNIPVLLKLLDRDLEDFTRNGFSASKKTDLWKISCGVIGVSDRGWSDFAIYSKMVLPDGTESKKVLHIPYMNISKETVYEYIGPFIDELKKYIP
jgi:hypothetical protein